MPKKGGPDTPLETIDTREARRAMSKNGFWYGYLNAGGKSFAVLRDPELDTGNRKTVYLFHLERNAIIEYNREIVETKLSDLDGEAEEMTATLEAAYAEARQVFGHARPFVPAATETPNKVATPAVEEVDPDGYVDDEDLDTDGLDLDEEET
jgi:hypothetical protein